VIGIEDGLKIVIVEGSPIAGYKIYKELILRGIFRMAHGFF
jgi:hypothetical protein